MPKVDVYNIEGKKSGAIELSDEIFGVEMNVPVVHAVVKAYLANQRQGTQSALTRSEVAGGGIKPYRQKGTGHARQGSIRAPQFRHGGTVFAPKPRDYRLNVPKKVKRLAMKCALSSKVQDGMVVLENLNLPEAKTKQMVNVLKNLGVEKKALVVLPSVDETVLRAANNLPNVTTTLVTTLNVYDILNHDSFIITKDAVELVQEVYV